MSDWAIPSALGDDEARGVLTSARRRRFKRGEVVFHRDDPADTRIWSAADAWRCG
jgi:hypothetical protein